MIRVLICDDQVVVCEGLRAILSTVPEVQVVGVANNGIEAIAQIPSLLPDLVLMDLKMPEMNGIQATRLIREQHPSVKVLVLTTYDADEWVIDAIRSGADGVGHPHVFGAGRRIPARVIVHQDDGARAVTQGG